jgi:hypothetical protein
MRHRRYVRERPQWEHPIQKASRNMIAQGMRVASGATHDGKMFLIVNGYRLTEEETLDLQSQRKLTTWDIREYDEKTTSEIQEDLSRSVLL